jgi:hypothetical protein
MRRWGDKFALAVDLGKHLHELMGWSGPMTYKQGRAWFHWRWQRWRWEAPTYSDMCALRAAQVHVKMTLGELLPVFVEEAPQTKADKDALTATAILASNPILGYVEKDGKQVPYVGKDRQGRLVGVDGRLV